MLENIKDEADILEKSKIYKISCKDWDQVHRMRQLKDKKNYLRI